MVGMRASFAFLYGFFRDGRNGRNGWGSPQSCHPTLPSLSNRADQASTIFWQLALSSFGKNTLKIIEKKHVLFRDTVVGA